MSKNAVRWGADVGCQSKIKSLEIRNDLIQDAAQQEAMAQTITTWLLAALADLRVTGVVQCQA